VSEHHRVEEVKGDGEESSLSLDRGFSNCGTLPPVVRQPVQWYRGIVKQTFFPVPVCAIKASGVPGGTFVSMNRFSTLCG
jgi:hypothetical protein